MNKIQRKRLSNVAKACREMAEPKKFDMKQWGYGNSCGTPACAIGNYAFRRDLQKTFKLNKDGQVTNNNGSEQMGFFDELGPNHFGITADESIKLFGDVGCDNAKTHIQAAEYIENFVATH